MAGMTRSGKPDFGIWLLLADQEFVRALRAATAAQGFDDQGRSDGFVLRTLGAGPTTISGLAERLEITKQGASQIVDDMERRGYVERRPDPTDARARLLQLTGKGEAALQAARKFHPVLVATGTVRSGRRMPAVSLPSLSTALTNRP